MENILNKIIELDRQAKQKVFQAKEKEENIESYISKKIEEEKQTIDSKYLNKKKIIQEKYDEKLEKRKKEIDEENKKTIDKLHQMYENSKQQILGELLNEII